MWDDASTSELSKIDQQHFRHFSHSILDKNKIFLAEEAWERSVETKTRGEKRRNGKKAHYVFEETGGVDYVSHINNAFT